MIYETHTIYVYSVDSELITDLGKIEQANH